MAPDLNITQQLIAERMRASAVQEPTAPSPIPPRPISYNTADPVLVALVRMDPTADPTDVAFLAAADAVAAQLDQLSDGAAPDALVRELLATLGSPEEVVAAIRYRYQTQRGGAPGADPTAERLAGVAALDALIVWASAIVDAWDRSSFAIDPALEVAVDRRITVAIDAGTLPELLEATANAADATTQAVTARLVASRAPGLSPGLLPDVTAFIAFAHGHDVETALALRAAASKARTAAAGVVALLAG